MTTETRTPYPHGSFCWTDLATRDADAAKGFYGALFGWRAHDVSPDGLMMYTIFQLPDGDVGGLYALTPEQQEQGMAPCWSVYVAVDSVDDSLAAIRSLGGAALVPAMDIPDTGRMAVAADPQGAVFCLWQRDVPYVGAARLAPQPGSVCWRELATSDPDAAKAFYGRAFGWQVRETAMADHVYVEWLLGDEAIGGMLPTAAAGTPPPHWLVYVAVADCEATVARAGDLGGVVLRPPFDVEGVGRIAVVADPQGAVLAVIAPAPPAG